MNTSKESKAVCTLLQSPTLRNFVFTMWELDKEKKLWNNLGPKVTFVHVLYGTSGQDLVVQLRTAARNINSRTGQVFSTNRPHLLLFRSKKIRARSNDWATFSDDFATNLCGWQHLKETLVFSGSFKELMFLFTGTVISAFSSQFALM